MSHQNASSKAWERAFDPSRLRASAALCLGACALAAFGQGAPAVAASAPITRGYSVMHSFAYYNAPQGHGPSAALSIDEDEGTTLLGANFFGGEAQRRCDCVLGGVLYALMPGGAARTLHTFSGEDGIGPTGALVRGKDGLWYGLTAGGGASGFGTAFRMAGDGSRFRVLHSFGATPEAGRQPSPGPLALASDGSFYGTTSRGGSAGYGTLFRMAPGGAVTILHEFAEVSADGLDPEDQPTIGPDGNIYGTTTCGGQGEEGAHCGGTLYRLSPSGDYAVLHVFGTKDGGYHPLSSPVPRGTTLFGTTSAGGAGDFGVVYRFGLDGTGFVKMHDFGGGVVASPPNEDGARPVGRLLVASDGMLYGTTSNGGPNDRTFPAGDGTIFRLWPYQLIGVLGTVGADAAHPVAGLVEDRDGHLYGTTDNGGTADSGTVFRFDKPPAPFTSGADTATADALADGGTNVPDMVEYAKAWGLVVADFDGDGRTDIFIAGHDQEDRIWYGSPTGFRPGPQALPWHDRHGCVAADVDHDGRLDIFCAIGAEKGTAAKANELWHQDADGLFTSVPDFGAEDTYGRGRKPLFLDLNHDGWPDIYITNDATPRHDHMDNFNHMFLNRGDGTFVEFQTVATGQPGKPELPGAQCAVRGDIDGDGWDDLLVCSHDRPGTLYVNNHANDFTVLLSTAGRVWKDARLVDMNADGRDDLVDLTLDQHFQIWLNTGAFPYYVLPAVDFVLPVEGVGLTTGDFDDDARRDVYVVLRDACHEGAADAPDAIFHQTVEGQWTFERLAQKFGGCGNLAETLDRKHVLLANGTQRKPGPNFVMKFGASPPPPP